MTSVQQHLSPMRELTPGLRKDRVRSSRLGAPRIKPWIYLRDAGPEGEVASCRALHMNEAGVEVQERSGKLSTIGQEALRQSVRAYLDLWLLVMDTSRGNGSGSTRKGGLCSPR